VTFTDLDYADDVALLDEMLSVLLLALEVLHDEARHMGLEVNWQKPSYCQPLLSLIYQPRSWFPATLWML